MFLPPEMRNINGYDDLELKNVSEERVIGFSGDERDVLKIIEGEDKDFYSPKMIFGTPFDKKCLRDVGNYSLKTPNIKLYSLADAQIVGPKSLLTSSSLYSLDYVNSIEDLSTKYRLSHSRAGFYHSNSTLRIKKFVNRESVLGNTFFISDLEPGNFGSFIFRTLPQLILIKELGVSIDLIVLPDSKSWSTSALTTLFPDIKFIDYSSSHKYVYKKIIYFNEFSYEGLFCKNINKLMSRVVDEVFVQPLNDHSRVDKIFISRKLSSIKNPSYRPLINEAQLEDIAKSKGFKVIYPEELPLKMQFKIICNAKCIITTSGSNCYPILFCKNKPVVLHLESFTHTVRQAYKIFASSSCHYFGLFGSIEDPSKPIYSPWSVDLDIFRSAVIETEEYYLKNNFQ